MDTRSWMMAWKGAVKPRCQSEEHTIAYGPPQPNTPRAPAGAARPNPCPTSAPRTPLLHSAVPAPHPRAPHTWQ